MSQLGTAIGLAGAQTLKRIPNGTVISYTSVGAHTLTVFNSIDKKISADVAQTTGNAGEWLAERQRNKRIEVHVECKPVGAATANVLAILLDPPTRLTPITIATSEDTQLNNAGNWYINSDVDIRYSPDGDAIISFDLMLRLADDGVTPLTITQLGA